MIETAEPPEDEATQTGLDDHRETWRWRLTLALGSLVVATLLLLHAPAWFVVASGLAAAAVAIGGVVLDIVGEHDERVEAIWQARSVVGALAADERLDDLFHDPLKESLDALESLRRQAIAREARPAETDVLARAQQVLTGLDTRFRDTRDQRARFRRTARDGRYRRLELSPDDDAERPDDEGPMLLYSDPMNLPAWVPDRLERPVTAIGALLDEVRKLHDAEIERAVLLFTMWARLLLVALAPILAGATFGTVPGADGLGAADLPWGLAVICSVATALSAPRLATAVMRRDERGAQSRRALLWLEVPICVAAILCTPCWPVMVFAAGWTNWWQRPVFNWVKLVIWIVAVSGALVAGQALAGDLGWDAALECAIAMAVIGVIGGSYGAMLPISLSALTVAIISRLLVDRVGARQADERLSAAIGSLLDAASITLRYAPVDDERARRDAERLRAVATRLAFDSDLADRRRRRVPLGLGKLLGTAAGDIMPLADTPQHEIERRRELDRGRPEPVSLLGVQPEDDAFEGLRFKARRHARVCSELAWKIAAEARRHGTGGFIVFGDVGEDAVQLRFVNAPKTHRQPGRGNGGDRIEALRRRLPGAEIPVREDVLAAEAGLAGSKPMFCVTVILPLSLFERTDR